MYILLNYIFSFKLLLRVFFIFIVFGAFLFSVDAEYYNDNCGEKFAEAKIYEKDNLVLSSDSNNNKNINVVLDGYPNMEYIGKSDNKVFFIYNNSLYYSDYNGINFNYSDIGYLKLFNNNIVSKEQILFVDNRFLYYKLDSSIYKITTNCNDYTLKGGELFRLNTLSNNNLDSDYIKYLGNGKNFIFLGDALGNIYKLDKVYNYHGTGNDIDLITNLDSFLFSESIYGQYYWEYNYIYFTLEGKTYRQKVSYLNENYPMEIVAPFEISGYVYDDKENIYYNNNSQLYYIKKDRTSNIENLKYDLNIKKYITTYGGFDYYIASEINEFGLGNQVYKINNSGSYKLTDIELLIPMFNNGKYYYFNGINDKVYKLDLEGDVSGSNPGGGDTGGGVITNPDTGETQNNTNNTVNSDSEKKKIWDYYKNKETINYTAVTDSTQGDPVLLHSGEFLYENTLINYAGKNIDFNFDITYKNQSNYNGPMGYNFDFGYNKYIQIQENGDIKYYDGNLGVTLFEYDELSEDYIYDKNTNSQLYFDGEYYYIVENNDITYVFGNNKKLIEVSDNYGNYISFEYDETNKLNKIIDTLENEYELIYRDDTRLEYIIDFNGNKVFFDYLENESVTLLESITLINGDDNKTVLFSYDENNNISGLIDFDGNIYVENIYDNQKRVINQKFGEGNITYDYTLSEDETYILKNEVITRTGDKVIYTYSSGGQILKKEIFKNSGNSYDYNYEYDENNNVIKEIFPLGNAYTYSYDGNNNLIEKRFKKNINSENSEEDIVFYYEYDLNFNKKIKEIFPNGTEIKYILNHLGDVISKQTIALDLEIIETFEYNEFGEIIKKIDGSGNITIYEYDGSNLSKIIQKGVDYDIVNKYEYDSFGNITKLTDGEGNDINLSYNNFNLLSKQITSSGIETNFEYNSLNKKTKEYIILGEGKENETVFEYDILDNPTKVITNIDSIKDKTIVTKYDADNRIIETQNGNNAKNIFDYDENGNITKKSTILNNGDEIITSYIYDLNNRLVKQVSPNNSEIQFEYDLFDRLVKTIYIDSSYTTNTYDNMGNIIEMKTYDSNDNLLSKTNYEYDLLSRKIKQINYLLEEDKEIITAFEYDNNSNIISQTNALNQTTSYEYDSFNRVIKTIDNLGNILEYIYDKNDNIIQENIIGYDEKTISKYNKYDSDNRLIETKDNIGNITKLAYNNLNQVVLKTDPKGVKTYYKYDYIGNILSETTGDKQIKYSYDEYGNMTKVIDANSNETKYEYDSLNRLVKHIYPDNSYTSYEYDANSNIIKKIDANGTIVDYTYDSQNRLIQKDITLGEEVLGVTQENYFYDSLGRLIKTTNNKGSETLFSYDSLNRLTSETQNGKIVNYKYDYLGNRTSIGLDGKTTIYNYDSDSRLESILRENKELVRYNYDSLNIVSKTYNNGKTTTYSYDSQNRLSQLNNDIKEYNYTYDDNNNILSNGDQNYSYDKYNQIIGVEYNTRLKNKDIVGYSYDDMGNRVEEKLSRKNKRGKTKNFKTFGYITNELNQYENRYKQKSNKKPKDDIGFELELGINNKSLFSKIDIGNIENEEETEQQQEEGELNGKLVYDNNGNMVGNMLNNKRQYIYSYDYKNRLVKVEKIIHKNKRQTKNKIIEYKYDNLDRRVQKIFNNGSHRDYYYSNQDIILEENYTKKDMVNSEGIEDTLVYKLKTSKYFINGNNLDDVLVMEKVDYNRKNKFVREKLKKRLKNKKIKWYKNRGNQNQTKTNLYYYHKNHLGSIVAISDEKANILEEYEYDAFGKPYSVNQRNGKITRLKKSKVGNTRLFTGREYERGLKLYYNRARYYNPILARFISRDPIDISDDVNLYAYVGNNPVMFVDLMGLEKQLLKDIENGNNFYVELVARNLDSKEVGFMAIHTFIVIHSYDKNLNKREYTIGGHNDSKRGKLDPRFNEPSDVVVYNAFWKEKGFKGSIFLDTPNKLTDKEFVQNIYNEYKILDENEKEYDLLSKSFWNNDGGNCNNFSSTILYNASGKDESIDKEISTFNPWGNNAGLGEYFK